MAAASQSGPPRAGELSQTQPAGRQRRPCQTLAISCHTAAMSGISELPMPNTYVKLMLQGSNDPARLLAGTGLEVDAVLNGEQPIVVWRQLACVKNSAAQMRRRDWHLDWVTRVSDRFHGPLSAAMGAAPTLGDGLDALVRYLPTRTPYLAWHAQNKDAHWRCEVRPLMDLGEIEALLVEIATLTMVAFVQGLRIGRLNGLRVCFPHQPLTAIADYQRSFSSEFVFNEPVAAVELPLTWRKQENAAFDATLYTTAIGRCEESLELTADGAFAARIARALHDSFTQRWGRRTPPTLSDMADHLYMSVRTLNRRLQAAGLTYTGLIEDVRRQRALELLRHTRRPMGQLAGLLGYRDPASFGRAFRRWYGTSPGQYRKQQVAAGSVRAEG